MDSIFFISVFKKVRKFFLLCFFVLLFFSSNGVFAEIQKIEEVFSDITQDYKYYNELQTLYDRGMVFPDETGRFNAKRLLNRDEFVGIAMEVTCKKCISPDTDFSFIRQYSNVDTFYDVAKSNKYFYCIAESDKKGYVKGYDVGYKCDNNIEQSDSRPFCVDNKITLEEALAVILRNSGIFTIVDNKKVIKEIYDGKISKNLSDDVFAKNTDGVPYTFYGYFQKALEFELREFNSDGEEKIYKLLDVANGKIRPTQNISKEDFLKIAYIALKSNSCVTANTNELALNMNIFNKQCSDNDKECSNRTFDPKEDTFDFSSEVYGICENGINEETGYTWRFYNTDTGKEHIKYGEYINDYTFLEKGNWKVFLSVKDKCGNTGEVYSTLAISGDKSVEDSGLAVGIDAFPLTGNIGLTPQFKGFADGGDGNYTYKWLYGDGEIGYGNNTNHTYGESGTYIVELIVTDSSGKTGKSTVTIVVGDNKNPNTNTGSIIDSRGLAIQIEANPLSGKEGVKVNLKGLVEGGDGNYVYSWDFGDEKTGEGEISKHLYSQEGQYRVKLTVKDGNGKTGDAYVDISVYKDSEEEKSDGLGVQIVANPLLGAPGVEVDFVGLAEGGQQNYTYSWDFGDGEIGNGEKISHIFPEEGIYEVVLKVLDTSGKEGEAKVTILVSTQNLDADRLGVEIEANPLYTTIGRDIDLKGLVEGGDGNYTFNWNFDDSSFGGGREVIHDYSRKGTYNVVLSVNDSSGRNGFATVNLVILEGNGTGNGLGAMIDAEPLSGEPGVEVDFLGIGEGGDGKYTYSWNFGDDTIGKGERTSHVFDNEGTYIVELKITDTSGNSGIAKVNIYVKAKQEGNNDLAVAIKADPISGFIGSEINFDAIVEGGDGNYIYSWNFGDDTIAKTKKPKHIYSKQGIFIVTLDVSDGSGRTGKNTASIKITDFLIPNDGINIDILADPRLGNAKLSVAFEGIVINPEDKIYEYSWNFGDASIGYGKNITHLFVDSGIYTVKLVISDTDGNSGDKITNITVSDGNSCEIDQDGDEIMDCDDKCPTVSGDIGNEGCPILEDSCSNTCGCQEGYECTNKDILECSTKGVCVPKKEVINSCLESGYSSFIYGNATCNSCPCSHSLDFKTELRKCDFIFPAITSPDSSRIYSRGEIYRINK